MAKSSKERKKRAHRKREKQQLHQNGRPFNVRDEEDDPPRGYTIKGYALRHRASKLEGIIKRYPQHIALGLATREEAGWLFGQLFIVGVITYDQKLAAERLSYAVSNYRKLLHRYGTLKASNVEGRVDGTIGEDLSPQIERRVARAVEEYDRNINVLRFCGEEVERAVLQALETDNLTDLNLICTGLDSLYNTIVKGSRGRKAGAPSGEALDITSS